MMAIKIVDQHFIDLFFSSDILHLNNHPDSTIQEKVRNKNGNLFDFNGIDDPLKTELKQFLQYILSKEISAKTLSSNYLKPLIHLLDFIKNNIEVTSLKCLGATLEVKYKSFLVARGASVTHPTNGKSVNLRILEKAHLFSLDLYSGSDPYNQETWKLEELGIDQTRFVESIRRKTITFHKILAPVNKQFAKEYIKYLLLTTDKSISTICSAIKDIKLLLFFLNYKELTNINRNDIEAFLEHLNQRKIKDLSFNMIIFSNIRFLEYLIVKGHLTNNYFNSNDTKELIREHNYKAIDESVIKQVFSVLDQLPFQESCMFLLLYSTGMRVSEVCAIKKDALSRNQNGYFIRFYQQKMKKEVMNPIPESL